MAWLCNCTIEDAVHKHKQLSHLGSSVLLLPGVLGALELAAALQLLASRTDLRGPRPRSLSGESERADCGDSVPASDRVASFDRPAS